MRPSKKFMTTLLPTFLALMGTLMAACGPTNPTQPVINTKAPHDKQVLISPEVGISDINTFDPALSPVGGAYRQSGAQSDALRPGGSHLRDPSGALSGEAAADCGGRERVHQTGRRPAERPCLPAIGRKGLLGSASNPTRRRRPIALCPFRVLQRSLTSLPGFAAKTRWCVQDHPSFSLTSGRLRLKNDVLISFDPESLFI